MNTQSYIIRPLDKNDLLQAAEICADAMNDNPIHIRVFGADSLVRKRRLQGFFSGMLSYVYRKGDLYGAFIDNSMIGVLGMLPPKHCKPSFIDTLRLLPTLLTSNSPLGTIRLAVWLSSWAKIDPATPHWHLGPLSVAPAWQGKNIGTLLIKFACKKGAGDNMYLETDKLSNVQLYQRFGFSILATPSMLGIPSWVMMRER